ncbi:MAG TPA: DNA/RNA non-specific endonuclease [Chitinophaga sp.]
MRQLHVKPLYVFLCCTLVLTACNKNIRLARRAPHTGRPFIPPAVIPADNDNLLLGNPSQALPDTADFNNYLMVKPYYTLCYNRNACKPNWVSWHLGSGDLGTSGRGNDFRADSALPAGWYHVSDRSYVGSGFDRGHNCPSADRTESTAANSATFLMSNMMPQAPNNNQHTWANFENYIRTLVKAGNEVYVIMGSYGITGTGSKGTVTAIDNGRIAVPAYIWKVAVVLPNGDHDLSRIHSNTRVIAINTPNINNISSDWKRYRTNVAAIEAATGYNLLSNVADSVQRVIEARVDTAK